MCGSYNQTSKVFPSPPPGAPIGAVATAKASTPRRRSSGDGGHETAMPVDFGPVSLDFQARWNCRPPRIFRRRITVRAAAICGAGPDRTCAGGRKGSYASGGMSRCAQGESRIPPHSVLTARGDRDHSPSIPRTATDQGRPAHEPRDPRSRRPTHRPGRAEPWRNAHGRGNENG